MINKIQKIKVLKKFEGLRLDLFLTQNKFFINRSQALKHIAKHGVLLKQSPLKASYRLKAGDCLNLLAFDKPPVKDLTPYFLDLEIPYEDQDLLVINKPAGLVVHPAPGHPDKTLVNVLSFKKKLSPGTHPLRPGIVHRLDKEASGLMIIAKTLKAQTVLIRQFKSHEIKREYRVISLRPPSPITGRVESWILRHPKNRKKFISYPTDSKGGKKSLTFYNLVKQNKEGLSLIECRLKTGRTHQIRLHLSSLSCPIAGDKLYGSSKTSFLKNKALKKELKLLNRIALHAYRLRFPHPLSRKIMDFSLAWPKDLKNLLSFIT